MKYNLNWLLAENEKEERLKYVYFWGHRPSKDGSVTKSIFSQWWEESFVVDGINYASAEHWMMAKKAELFDSSMIEEIIQASSPALAKKLGRKVKNFDPVIWENQKYDIVKVGNFHKFNQHEKMKKFLLQTQDRILVEASPFDKIWGIGMVQDDPRAAYPQKWDGENLLGFALMEVRDELRD